MSAPALRHAHANILIGQDEQAAALYRIPVRSYTHAPARAKHSWWAELSRFVLSAGADFSLWRVCRAYPAEQFTDQALHLLDDRLQSAEAWRAHLARGEARLHEFVPFCIELYLAVSLATDPPSPLTALSRAADRAGRRVEQALGVAPPFRLSAAEVEELLKAEEKAFDRLGRALPGATRATGGELQWLLRRGAYRGVGEPALDESWEPDALVVEGDDGEFAYEPLGSDLTALNSSLLTESARAVRVEAESGASHQAFLTLGSLPEVTPFPGEAELLSTPLEALDFSVDAAVHVRVVQNRAAVGQVRRRIIDADVAYAEELQTEHGPQTFESEERRELARELHSQLKGSERPPLLRTSISLAVGAEDEEELGQRVEALRDAYGAVSLQRPLGLQRRLFHDHVPRAGGAGVRDYEQILTVEQVAALMPTGTQLAGPDRGALLGTLTNGAARPVLFDPTDAPRRGRAPAILLCGALGSGKTIAAQLLALHAERRGSRVVDVDPKPDHALERLPELDGRAETIELSSGERYAGALDPLVVAPAGLREELANAYLVDLLPSPDGAWQTEIRRAVREVLASERPSSLAVIEALRAAGDDGKKAAEALSVWAESGLGRLGFGDGGATGRESKAALTTIKARGLTLPDPAVPRSDYDQQERMSVATLKLVAAFAMGLVTGDRSLHKLVLVDEGWFLVASRDGRRLLDQLNRLGRSENATLVLSTQRIADAGELESLVGTRMVFRHETEAEARSALELLGLDSEDREMVERIRSYPAGRCLMRDTERRVAEVDVEVPEEVLAVLDTAPPAADRMEQ